MKTDPYIYSQPNYLFRAAIEAEILFAVCLSKCGFWSVSVKTPPKKSPCSKKIGAESAVLNFVFFIMLKNKIEQFAAQSNLNKKLLLSKIPTDRTFGNRHVGCKEREKINRRRTLCTLRINFFEATPQTACIFSKDDEHSQRVYIKYGNGVETRYNYDPARRWLKDIKTENKDKNLVFQKINYNFDAVGNVEGYINTASKYETSQNYSYDALYQLIKAEGTHKQYGGINPNPDNPHPSNPLHTNKYRQTFAFDIIGNMTNKDSTTNLPGGSIGTTDDTKLNYELDYEYDSKYAHRLIRAGTRYYRYDANGNITAEKDGKFSDKEEIKFTYSYFAEHDVYGVDYGFDLEPPEDDPANLETGGTTNTTPTGGYRRDYTWNERNLLIKSDDKLNTVIYRYGDDGQRALKFTQQSNSETLYFNNFYSVHQVAHEPNHEHGLRVSKHIFVGNSRLVTAMTHADNNGDTTEQNEKRYYYHADHLQSAQFITNAKGEQYEHIEYTPYGELWIEETAPGIDKLPFRFTGKELDEETGLYYYGARYLDPKYSRWLSGDPALGEYIPQAPINDKAKKHNENLPGMGGVFNVVNLHVYHYAGNNPVKYIDPDGERILDVDNSLFQGSGGDTILGATGSSTISAYGCVLTGYTRIGNHISGKNYSLTETNSIAVSNSLFVARTNENGEEISARNLLSVSKGVELINLMTGNANLFVIHKDSKSFSYKSNFLTEIAAYINKWGNSGGNYYLLARIEKGYYNSNGKFISTGGHTVNINAKSNNVSNLDDLLNAFNIGINNTQEGHPTGDTITKNSVWKITRIDVLQSIKLPDNAN